MSDEDRLFLLRWAEKNGCLLETHGTAGFGRAAVGIVRGEGYVDLGPTVSKTTGGDHPIDYEDQEIGEGAWPPEGVTDAYHKHNCLCVLAPGADEAEDYEGALRQLAVWVRHLDAQGFRVATSPRKPSSSIDMLFHGIEYAYLTTAAGGDPHRAD